MPAPCTHHLGGLWLFGCLTMTWTSRMGWWVIVITDILDGNLHGFELFLGMVRILCLGFTGAWTRWDGFRRQRIGQLEEHYYILVLLNSNNWQTSALGISLGSESDLPVSSWEPAEKLLSSSSDPVGCLAHLLWHLRGQCGCLLSLSCSAEMISVKNTRQIVNMSRQ